MALILFGVSAIFMRMKKENRTQPVLNRTRQRNISQFLLILSPIGCSYKEKPPNTEIPVLSICQSVFVFA